MVYLMDESKIGIEEVDIILVKGINVNDSTEIAVVMSVFNKVVVGIVVNYRYGEEVEIIRYYGHTSEVI